MAMTPVSDSLAGSLHGHSSAAQRVVLCMKWGTLYSAEYVNVLYQACRAHLRGDFRFVCLTDESVGLLPDIEVYPIPQIGLDEWHYYNGAWPKIGVFSAPLYGLQGRALFIDLDSVICGPLDDLFDVPGALVALDSQPWSNKPGGPRTGTGVFAFDLGSMAWVVDRLRSNRDPLVTRYRLEQDYLHGEVPDIQYWPQPWIVSFKYHLRQPLLLDRWREPRVPPDSAKIVAFHGRPRPIDLIRPPRGNWDRFPHYGSGPVSWMQHYWQRFGGNI
jgi:hypothetical protein